jgi:hypothetical protein
MLGSKLVVSNIDEKFEVAGWNLSRLFENF